MVSHIIPAPTDGHPEVSVLRRSKFTHTLIVPEITGVDT